MLTDKRVVIAPEELAAIRRSFRARQRGMLAIAAVTLGAWVFVIARPPASVGGGVLVAMAFVVIVVASVWIWRCPRCGQPFGRNVLVRQCPHCYAQLVE